MSSSSDPSHSSADDYPTQQWATPSSRSDDADQPTAAIPAVDHQPDERTTRLPQMEREEHDPDPATQRIPELHGDDDAYGTRRMQESGPRFATPADPYESPEERRARRESEDAERSRHQHWDAKAAYGGMNLGAALYGWLCAFGFVMLAAMVTAVLMVVIGLGSDASLSGFGDLVGNSGLPLAVGGAVLTVVCTFLGGYVAGRMSRFDGARQGVGVWVFVLLSVAAVVGGVVLLTGSVDPPESMSWVTTVATPSQWPVAIWIGMGAGALVALIGSVLGAKVGHRYHVKVDRMLDPRA